MVMLSSTEKSDRRIGDMYYACKQISDEAFEYVLKVAKCFAIDDSNIGKRLIKKLECSDQPDGSSVLSISWTFDGDKFISDTYTRSDAGKWTSHKAGAMSVSWSSCVEAMYQQYKNGGAVESTVNNN